MLFVEVLISTNPIAHRHHLTPGGEEEEEEEVCEKT